MIVSRFLVFILEGVLSLFQPTEKNGESCTLRVAIFCGTRENRYNIIINTTVIRVHRIQKHAPGAASYPLKTICLVVFFVARLIRVRFLPRPAVELGRTR